MTPAKRDVHSSSKSGHSSDAMACPLRAKSRHSTIHSITSSARVSSVGGMVRLSANSAWLVFHWVDADGSTMSALVQQQNRQTAVGEPVPSENHIRK
jgi:hypothetical protein